MRRVLALSLAAVLLLSLPVAAGAGKQGKVAPTVPPASTSDPARAHASAGGGGSFAASDTASIVSLGLGGFGLLALSLFVASIARKKKAHRPPKRSFEAGRAVGRATRVSSEADALAALQRPGFANVTALWASEGRVRVAVARRRGETCELVGGYLTGLFEGAWAADAAVRHDRCGGRKRQVPCEYEIIRVGPRTAATSIPRSAAATGRSLQAPGGRA